MVYVLMVCLNLFVYISIYAQMIAENGGVWRRVAACIIMIEALLFGW
jgi:hypothetical protein